MEVGENIVFGGAAYRVTKRFYKSWGSQNQTISVVPDDRTDSHKSYYVVARGSQTFWVKEWSRPEAPHLIGTLEDEYRRLIEVGDIRHEESGISVRSVRAHEFENNRILMEHLSSYSSLRGSRLDAMTIGKIKGAARGWIRKSGLSGTYDLCENNVMTGMGSEVVMIDFEMSTGEDRL